jgi:hypothetical protein
MASEKSVHEGTSDEALVNEAERLAVNDTMKISARQMEMTLRNNIALRAFNASSESWSKRLTALTAVLVVFTAVLIYLAWALLQRGG